MAHQNLDLSTPTPVLSWAGHDLGPKETPMVRNIAASQLDGKHKAIRNAIEAAVPVGFEQNKAADKAASNWQGWRSFKGLHKGVQRLEGKALKQLGSLGGQPLYRSLPRHRGSGMADAALRVSQHGQQAGSIPVPWGRSP